MEDYSDNCNPLFDQNWISPQSDNEAQPNFTSQHVLLELQRAKQRFHAFAQQLGSIALTPIREDIRFYCDGQRKQGKGIEFVLKPETILRKLEMRIDKMLKTKRIKRNWGEEDLKILIWVVSKYADQRGLTDLEKELNQEDWRFMASVIPGVTQQGCMFKWLSIKKVTLATNNWTEHESLLLADVVKVHLNLVPNSELNWKAVSQELYKMNDQSHKVYRNAKQCREHWTCYLSPQLKKGPWQLYQDVKLLKFIKDNKGLKKWSEIARSFDGRTQNALKNRYTLIIEKQKRQPRNRNKPQIDLINEYLQKCYVEQFTQQLKVAQGMIFREENVQIKAEADLVIQKGPQIRQICFHDSSEIAVTPVRVERFNFSDFEAIDPKFFKDIQPGVMQSDGTFKKIVANPELKKQDENKKKVQQVRKGPFILQRLTKKGN